MTCHIMHGLRTLCGKRLDGPDWTMDDSYVDRDSRRVLETPSCAKCRVAFHEEHLRRAQEALVGKIQDS